MYDPKTKPALIRSFLRRGFTIDPDQIFGLLKAWVRHRERQRETETETGQKNREIERFDYIS